MWRLLLPIFVIGLPIVAGLGLLYLFISESIGIATMLVGCFALGAFAVTVIATHVGSEEEHDTTRWGSL